MESWIFCWIFEEVEEELEDEDDDEIRRFLALLVIVEQFYKNFKNVKMLS